MRYRKATEWHIALGFCLPVNKVIPLAGVLHRPLRCTLPGLHPVSLPFLLDEYAQFGLLEFTPPAEPSGLEEPDGEVASCRVLAISTGPTGGKTPSPL